MGPLSDFFWEVKSDNSQKFDIIEQALQQINNKIMEQLQSKVVTLRISNLKFSVCKRKTSANLQPRNYSQTHQFQKVIKNSRTSSSVMVIQGFIPKNTIKASRNRSVASDKKVNNSLVNLSESTYSKFPCRRPKSLKINNFISIFRRKIKMNADALQKGEEDLGFNLLKRYKTNVSTTNEQCDQDLRNFMPYTHSKTKTEYVYRQPIQSRFQEVGRIYL